MPHPQKYLWTWMLLQIQTRRISEYPWISKCLQTMYNITKFDHFSGISLPLWQHSDNISNNYTSNDRNKKQQYFDHIVLKLCQISHLDHTRKYRVVSSQSHWHVGPTCQLNIHWISTGQNLCPCPPHELLDVCPMKSLDVIIPPYPCPEGRISVVTQIRR
jgi:hypothetical protein